MRLLVAKFGEKQVREHGARVLGYPADLCHTADEANRIRKSIEKSMT
jgi:hypothetical protein